MRQSYHLIGGILTWFPNPNLNYLVTPLTCQFNPRELIPRISEWELPGILRCSSTVPTHHSPSRTVTARQWWLGFILPFRSRLKWCKSSVQLLQGALTCHLKQCSHLVIRSIACDLLNLTCWLSILDLLTLPCDSSCVKICNQAMSTILCPCFHSRM